MGQAASINAAAVAPGQSTTQQAMTSQIRQAEQQQGLMQNVPIQQHTQPEPVTSMGPSQSGNPSLLSAFHRPVIETAQPFLAPS